MSPILVRPVREQLEHDRVIRLLQQDLSKRKVEVGINPGTEQNASVGAGSRKEYPDAVLYSVDKGKKVIGVVEVETGESVNHLEAMAQWAHLAKLKVPFHLYVPMGSVDVARRLSTDYGIPVTEIWSYHQVGDQFRFTLIHPVGSRGGRGASAPRTVSVASIRVARLPEIEVSAEEPLAPSPPASEAAPVPARRVVVAKARAVPASQAPGPAVKGAKGKAAPHAPAPPAPATAGPVRGPAKVTAAKGTMGKVLPGKVSPAKVLPSKVPSLKALPPKVRSAKASPPKVSSAKALPSKVSSAKASPPKPAQPTPAASLRPAPKALARPAAKSAVKSPARALRPGAVVKPAPRAPGRRK